MLQIELHDVKQRAADGDLFDLKNEKVETIAGTIVEKVGIDKAVKIARAILDSPEHDERERAEREQELLAAHRGTNRARPEARPTQGRDQEAEGGIDQPVPCAKAAMIIGR
jgi:hypothetical protein